MKTTFVSILHAQCRLNKDYMLNKLCQNTQQSCSLTQLTDHIPTLDLGLEKWPGYLGFRFWGYTGFKPQLVYY